MDIITKAVNATITDTSATAEEFPGTFEVELSNESTDRDGDTLKASEWEQPLPERITFVNDHTHKMNSVVGSAVPELIDGKMICKGDWAKSDEAQNTRKVIEHAPYVSVTYREKHGPRGGVSRELINGSFVVVPSNTKARVLSSKGFDDTRLVGEMSAKEFAEAFTPGVELFGGGLTLDRMKQLGLEIEVDEKSSTITVKNHDKVLGAHKFSPTPEGAPSDADPSSADPAKDDAAALELAKAAAFQMTTRTSEFN